MHHLTGHGSLPTRGTWRQSQLASFLQVEAAVESAEQHRLTTRSLFTLRGVNHEGAPGFAERRREDRLWCSRPPPGGVHVDRVYTHAHTIIDGLGHATRSATVPVCRSRTPSF